MLNPPAPADRFPFILERLRQAYPAARCALNYRNAFELLIAVILSAQTRDERVNQVTAPLFERWPTPAALASAPPAEVEAILRPIGFYRVKTRYIQATSQLLVSRWGGDVPDTMPALLSLVGVSRKTANVVLGEAFGIAEGVVVDTHVSRLSQRLGLTTATTPEKIEQDLMALVPPEAWIAIAHLFIFHGRQVCEARRPRCQACVLQDLCPSAGLV